MTEILRLRGYQEKAIKAILSAWEDGTRRPAVVLPTGAGKTVIFAHLGKLMHEHQGKRSLVLVHTNELVDQAVAKFRDVAPHLTVGVVKAERNEHAEADIIVATVQTLRSPTRRAQIANIGVVIVDECHHATATTYREILDHYGCRAELDDPWPEDAPDEPALAVGFTATLARNDAASLGEIWQKVVYRQDIIDMIQMSYLLPIRGKRVRVPDLDFSKVRKSRGDYQADELGEALTDSLAPSLVAKAYTEHAADRSGIIFTPTVDSAYVFAEAMREAGISCETVHGALPREERQLILKRFKSGDLQTVSNCMVLTEGFDEPRASCVVVARPTTSASLYTQMVGRVLRPYPGQTEALLLDVVGVTGRHKLASLVDLIGDKTKVLREEEESLADLLLTSEGLEFEEEEGSPKRPIRFQDADSYEVVDVDLFKRSHSAWLQTKDHVWFLSAGKADVFLVPCGGADTWNVGVIGTVDNRSVREFRYRRISLDAAMSWGEEIVREIGGSSLAKRKASWRRDNIEPGPKQIALARGLGIDPSFKSKGQLSDEISVILASRTIDPIVKRWTR